MRYGAGQVVVKDADGGRLSNVLGKGERIALSKLAVEHLEKTGRPFRIAIDAAIWQFQHQASQGGQNPELRTLYYRLIRLLALPIHPLFVYDGPNKPLTKRNKTVSRYGTCLANELSKKLILAFHYPVHSAPGEAEAECAMLQKEGIVDAVMSQDVDALMWGSTMTLKDWSQEGTRGNRTATHVSVLKAREIKARTKLDADGMILVALLSGGDYDTTGLQSFGPSLACEIAKAGFGAELLELIRKGDSKSLEQWRQRLQHELEYNERSSFRTKHKALRVPETFPDDTVLKYYTQPAVTSGDDLQRLRERLSEAWDQDIDLSSLRAYVARTFDWSFEGGAKKFIRTMAPALLAHQLRRGLPNMAVTSMDQIKERRIHYISDGMPELRVAVIPADVVGLDLSVEEDNPVCNEHLLDENQTEADHDSGRLGDRYARGAPQTSALASPAKAKKLPPWDPSQPEKMWISESIVRLGVPLLVEQWEQKQRDPLVGPKKLAARKGAKSKAKDDKMKPGALDAFFKISKPGIGPSESVEKCASLMPAVKRQPWQANRPSEQNHQPVNDTAIPKTPTKRASKVSSTSPSPKVDQYFRRLVAAPLAGLDRSEEGTLGVQLPANARYSALGLYGADANSSDVEATSTPIQRRTSAEKHSRSSTSESTEDQDLPTQPTSNLLFTIEASSVKFSRAPPAAAPRSTQSSIGGNDLEVELLNRDGTSFQESILVSSSPAQQPRHVSPIESFSVTPPPRSPSYQSLPSPSHLLSTVTQRKKTQSKTRPREHLNANSTPVTSSSSKPTTINLPSHDLQSSIEDIFRSFQATDLRRITQQYPPTTAAPHSPSIAMVLGNLESHSWKKKILLSRDSLPGTWKELDDGINGFDPSQIVHRPPRVSLIDLTSD